MVNWSEKELAQKVQQNRSLKVLGAKYRPALKYVHEVLIEMPMDLLTENKLRAMHPTHRGRLLRRQRWAVRDAWLALYGFATVRLPVTVTLTRIGRRMDSHDSLPAAFKAVTDELTERLGLRNDDTPLIRWVYAQEPPAGRPKSIRIEIRPLKGQPE